jgi:hypothetical protein
MAEKLLRRHDCPKLDQATVLAEPDIELRREFGLPDIQRLQIAVGQGHTAKVEELLSVAFFAYAAFHIIIPL